MVDFTCSDFPVPKEAAASSIPLPPRLLATAALVFFSCLRKAAISSTIDFSSIGANRGSSAQNSTECAQPVKEKGTRCNGICNFKNQIISTPRVVPHHTFCMCGGELVVFKNLHEIHSENETSFPRDYLRVGIRVKGELRRGVRSGRIG